MTTKQDPLSFWKRPEGKTGMIFLALIACGVGYALFFLLPFIIILLQNVLYAAILGVALAGLIFVLLDKRFRLMIWHGYKSIMRKRLSKTTKSRPASATPRIAAYSAFCNRMMMNGSRMKSA